MALASARLDETTPSPESAQFFPHLHPSQRAVMRTLHMSSFELMRNALLWWVDPIQAWRNYAELSGEWVTLQRRGLWQSVATRGILDQVSQSTE